MLNFSELADHFIEFSFSKAKTLLGSNTSFLGILSPEKSA